MKKDKFDWNRYKNSVLGYVSVVPKDYLLVIPFSDSFYREAEAKTAVDDKRMSLTRNQ